MAEKIMITPQELRTAASTFTTKADEIGTILNELNSLVESLESTWDGAAQDQFFNLYKEKHTDLIKVAEEILPGISETLESIAQTLEDTDEQIASSLQNNG